MDEAEQSNRDHHVRKVVNRICVMCQKPFTISSWHSRATQTCSYRCSGLYKRHKVSLAPLIEALKAKS